MTTLSTGVVAELVRAGWVRNLDQLASVTASTVTGGPAAGCRALDLRVARGIDLRLLPDRGLDLAAAWFAGVPLAWISPVGECGPLDSPGGMDWIERFGGGLLTTCGLRNAGAPSEGHGLHGRFSHQRAAGVTADRRIDEGELVLSASATIDEVAALGHHLRVQRTVTTRTGSGLVELVDVTRNLGDTQEAAPLLYHINLGAPLWGPGARLDLDTADVHPRDADAAAGIDEWMRPPAPTPGAPEQVFEHRVRPGVDGWSRATVVSPRTGLELEVRWEHAELGRFHQWRHPARSVLGLEPANCSVLGRGADRAAGTLPVLQPGQARTTRVAIAVRMMES